MLLISMAYMTIDASFSNLITDTGFSNHLKYKNREGWGRSEWPPGYWIGSTIADVRAEDRTDSGELRV
jgi:hypothetical protein